MTAVNGVQPGLPQVNNNDVAEKQGGQPSNVVNRYRMGALAGAKAARDKYRVNGLAPKASKTGLSALNQNAQAPSSGSGSAQVSAQVQPPAQVLTPALAQPNQPSQPSQAAPSQPVSQPPQQSPLDQYFLDAAGKVVVFFDGLQMIDPSQVTDEMLTNAKAVRGSQYVKPASTNQPQQRYRFVSLPTLVDKTGAAIPEHLRTPSMRQQTQAVEKEYKNCKYALENGIQPQKPVSVALQPQVAKPTTTTVQPKRRFAPGAPTKLDFTPRLTSINLNGKTYYVASLRVDPLSQASSSHAVEEVVGTRRIALAADVSTSMSWRVGMQEIWQRFKNFVKEISADEFKKLQRSAREAESLLREKFFDSANNDIITKYVEPSALDKFIRAFSEAIQSAKSPELVGLQLLEETLYAGFQSLSPEERQNFVQKPKVCEELCKSKIFTEEKKKELTKYFEAFDLEEHIGMVRSFISNLKPAEAAVLLAKPQEIASTLHQKFDQAFMMNTKFQTLEVNVNEFLKSRMYFQQKALTDLIDNELHEGDELMLFAFNERVQILQSSSWGGFSFVPFNESNPPEGIIITRENKGALKSLIQNNRVFKDGGGTKIMVALNAMGAFQQNAAVMDRLSGAIIPAVNIFMTDGDDPEVTKEKLAAWKAKFTTPTAAAGMSPDHDKQKVPLIATDASGYVDSSDMSRLSPAIRQICKRIKGVVTGKTKCTLSADGGAAVGNIWHQGKLAQKAQGDLSSSETVDFPALYMGRVQKIVFDGEPRGKYKVIFNGDDFTNGDKFATQSFELNAEDIQEDPDNLFTVQFFSIFEPALQDMLSASSKEEKINILRGSIEALPVENSQLKAALLKVMLAVEDGEDVQRVVDEVLANRHETSFTESMKQTHRLIKRLTSRDKFLDIHSKEARALLQDAQDGECIWRLSSQMASETEIGRIALTVKHANYETRDGVKGLFEELFTVTDTGELLCDDDTSPLKGLYATPDEVMEAFNFKVKSKASSSSGSGSGSNQP